MTALKMGLYASALWASSLAFIGAPAHAATPGNYLVFFDFDKSELSASAVAIVDQAAANAAAGKATKIEVTGYTDTVGSDAYNLRLSKRRAMSVQAELTKQGIGADLIAVDGKGKHDLLVPTGDGVKEPQNRRVSIVYAVRAEAPAPVVAAAAAAEEKKEEAAATPPPVFGIWAQLEAGITANPDSPRSGVNYGHLFTDKSNQPILNQLLLTAEKPIDVATDYNLGFRLQGMFGADARYTAYLGEFDQEIKGRTQISLVEAWVGIHTPWIGEGGMEIKVGQYPTLLGAEVIDPSANVFYSKSYIFNFGLPLVNTGVMTISHLNSTLDVYVGYDTGVNTTFGDGDNNGSGAFQGGIGLNALAGGKVTIVAFTHIGPENVKNNKDYRYLNDIVLTYKASDVLTFISELNYIHEEVVKADGYGFSQYVTYALDDQFTLGGRAEIWRDQNNFFVGAFPGNRTFTQFERGFALDQPPLFATGPTTYSELTLGVTWKPPLPNGFQGLAIRPEIRFDDALDGAKPYNDGKSASQFTFGIDVVLKI